MESGECNVVTIPFYNHYAHESSVTSDYFDLIFTKHKIHIPQKPCLCHLDLQEPLPSMVIIQGDYEIQSPCYDSIITQIQKNPETSFFILGCNLSWYNHSPERIKRRLGDLTNYKAWTHPNWARTIDKIINLAQQHDHHSRPN